MKKKELREKGNVKVKGGLSDFKDFISRGNVVDMAVGVIIGGAFGKIVTSLVNDMFMPLIGTKAISHFIFKFSSNKSVSPAI